MPSAVPITIHPRSRYASDTFALRIEIAPPAVRMVFTMRKPVVNTRELPHTYALLERHLPDVLTTQCYNDERHSFRQELKKTEIAHLFEHILLRYLCDEKLASGKPSAQFTGRTAWNWVRDPEGTFYIRVGIKKEDIPFFSPALTKSIRLIERLLLPLVTAPTP